MTEIVQVISYDGDGKATTIDRYSVPAPSSTDANVIAAQERKVLQNLLVARETAASTGGRKKVGEETLGEVEYESLAVLDRRIAEAARASCGLNRPPPGTSCRGRNTGRPLTAAPALASDPAFTLHAHTRRRPRALTVNCHIDNLTERQTSCMVENRT